MDRLISEKEILKNAFYIKRKGCGLIDVVEVDAIKAIPSAEPKICEKCLYAEEIDGSHCYECVKGESKFEPKTGHWIEEDMFDGDVAYRCSECNELFWIESGTPKDNGYDFCPKCGARMVEPQERSNKE